VGDRVTHARKTLKMPSFGSNLLPTGVAALAGVSETGNDIKHIRNHTRANLRLMQPWAFAYAANDHTGF